MVVVLSVVRACEVSSSVQPAIAGGQIRRPVEIVRFHGNLAELRQGAGLVSRDDDRL
jgi:hypothetical protein